VPANELSLCTTVPPGQAGRSRRAYIWTTESPLDRFPAVEVLAGCRTSWRRASPSGPSRPQPLDYAKAVFHDNLGGCSAGERTIFPNAPTYDEYIFGYRSLPIPAWDKADLGPYDSYAAGRTCTATRSPTWVAPFAQPSSAATSGYVLAARAACTG